MHHFNKQVAVITGAGRGIGRAIALALAEKKVNLALVGRNASNLQQVATACSRFGVACTQLACDLSDPKSAKGVVQQTLETLGGISYLVNNAGVAMRASMMELDLDAFDKLLDVNVRAVMHLTRHALPHIAQASHGAVINIASVSGKSTYAGGAAYCASKHAVVGFSHALFEDVRAKNIKVCAICPGYVATDMVAGYGLRMDRVIAPEDIAQAVLYVLSQSSTVCPTEIILRPQQPQPAS